LIAAKLKRPDLNELEAFCNESYKVQEADGRATRAGEMDF